MKKTSCVMLMVVLAVFASCSKDDDEVIVSSIFLDKSELNIQIGEKYQLKSSYSPSTAILPSYSWISSDSEVASVSDEGIVTAASEGTATITLSANDGVISAICEITVSPIAVSSITLNKKTLDLSIGAKDALTYTILPDNATNKQVKWDTADESIATVKDGVVSAISQGKTTITVSTNDGVISATCEVIVSPIAVTGISFDKVTVNLINGNVEYLNATISPINVTNQNVTWSSSDNLVATVDKGEVTGLSIGESTITVTTEDGGYTATCVVTVIPVSVTGISLNKSSLNLLIDDAATLTSIIYPEYAANKNIIWSSSNESVATVDQAGIVNAVALGMTTLTATTEDGNYTSDCTVNVVSITSQIKLSFVSGSIASINGFIIGDLFSKITNESSHSINLTKLEIIDSNTGRVKGRSADGDILDDFKPGDSINQGMKLNSVYKPIFKWYFTYNGENYSVQHQY